jgi:tRNA threonylcarbamoyladenosine biosynthesis protein TsaE
VKLRTTSPEETEALGERLGKQLRSGDVVCLAGDLGAGKTCLTRGLAHGWGAQERATSPTFILVNEYHRAADSQRFFHMDCYRLSGAAEAQTVALDDLLDAPGVLIIEWPERIAPALPPDRLWVDILDRGDTVRELVFHAGGKRARRLLNALVAPG